MLYRGSAKRLEEFYRANPDYHAEVLEDEEDYLADLKAWADQNGILDGSIDDKLRTENLYYQYDDKDPNLLTVEVSGITPHFATRIRRAALSQVPVMAIDDVWVLLNNSIYHEDMLRGRLKLIPLVLDPNQYEDLPVSRLSSPEAKIQHYDDENTVAFLLDTRDIDRAATTVRQLRSFYASDLRKVPVETAAEYLRGEVELREVVEQAEPAESILFGHIELFKLSKDEDFSAILFAYRGTAEERASFAALSDFTYRYVTQVTITSPIKGEAAKALKKLCPFGVYDIEDTGNAKVGDTTRCTLCTRCLRDPRFADSIETERDTSRFIFKVESIGALDPKSIFDETLRIAIRGESQRGETVKSYVTR